MRDEPGMGQGMGQGSGHGSGQGWRHRPKQGCRRRILPRLLARLTVRLLLGLLLGLLLSSSPDCAALFKKSKKPGQATTKPTPPEVALKTYIERVRAEHDAERLTPGSIWSDQGSLVRLSNDAKATKLHDVISIVVTESLAASTDGQVKNSRASTANSSITGLFGVPKATSTLANLLAQNSSSGLTAQGQSVTNSSLVTTFGGEVVDLLPNGMMVVQATRQLTFSQQTQVIRLRGLVRPEDVNFLNQVDSSAMTDLEIEVVGKGIVNDSTYRQNPIWRFLQKILIF